MNIDFFEPPPAQKAGGLQAAIDSLRAALEKLGHVVKVNGGSPAKRHTEVVHFHGLWQRNFPSIAATCARQGIPYVVSPHGMLEPWARRAKWWKKWPYFLLIEKRWISRSEAVLATAESEGARLRAIFPLQRIVALPLGLTSDCAPDYQAARTSLGWNAGETVLLFLSRIHEKKGLDLLLAALASLHGSIPEAARLVIVGPEEQPDYARKCRNFIVQNQHSLPKTDWLGSVWGGERWKFFQGADLFCLPTHSENFGLAVLEACQVGTTVLTTTETPWADSLGSGRGFIARPELGSLRKELARFFSAPKATPEDRDSLADWAQKNFCWSGLAPQYAALYESLIR